MEEKDLEYYKKAYEEERAKNRALIERVSVAEENEKNYRNSLEHIKNSSFWKASKPARDVIHYLQRVKVMRGIKKNNRNKTINSMTEGEKAKLQHGTLSFPKGEEAKRQMEKQFTKDITFSILVPLYNTPENFLRDMIESVTSQTYQKWELCLADGSDSEHENVGTICQEYMANDKRIVYKHLDENTGISGNSNACLAISSGNYIGLLDHDDMLHPAALYYYMEAIEANNADFIYCDELTFTGDSVDNMNVLHFKPEYAPDNLLANNYITHFSVFSRELMDNVLAGEEEGSTLFRSKYDGSQDHDLILRLTSHASCVSHVARILYYWRNHENSTSVDLSVKGYAIEAAKNAIAYNLRSKGLDGFNITSTKIFETIFRIEYELVKKGKVSIIIPNKNHKDDLKNCVDSILKKTTYQNYEIIVVENNSTDTDIFAYYKELEAHPKIKVVTYNYLFNYPAINNFGVQHAEGEYVVLLNNDTEVITANWIEELMMFAQRDDVGAVGLKLYFPDYTIQNAGIFLGIGPDKTAGNGHYRFPKEHIGYMGRLCFNQNVTAVSGACMMVKKSDFDKIGGMNEEFTVMYGDVDLCLRLRELGKVNVWTPFAEMIHMEKSYPRTDMYRLKADFHDEETKLFKEKYASLIEKGDTYFNPNFSTDNGDFSFKLCETN